MSKQKVAKEFARPIRIVVENHKVIEIDIGRCISTDLDPYIVTTAGWKLEMCTLLDGGDFDRCAWRGEEGAPEKVSQVRLQFSRYAAPLIEEDPESLAVHCRGESAEGGPCRTKIDMELLGAAPPRPMTERSLCRVRRGERQLGGGAR
ncbi:MAG TPA: hypothetical protein VKM54_07160 [Myxococcota bacterium]|nr:hypothetical protein [Myxococcota bacterium]